MRTLLCILLVLIPSQSFAYYQCNVQVRDVLVYGDGSVNVRHTGRNDFTYVCNLQAVRLGVGVSTCAMWTSLLLNVKKNNSTAQFYFDGTGSCAALPTYTSAPAPLYIGDITP
jgi:hypothetical protein